MVFVAALHAEEPPLTCSPEPGEETTLEVREREGARGLNKGQKSKSNAKAKDQNSLAHLAHLPGLEKAQQKEHAALVQEL